MSKAIKLKMKFYVPVFLKYYVLTKDANISGAKKTKTKNI